MSKTSNCNIKVIETILWVRNKRAKITNAHLQPRKLGGHLLMIFVTHVESTLFDVCSQPHVCNHLAQRNAHAAHEAHF